MSATAFLVISSDQNEGQTFLDMIVAPDEETARNIVAEERGDYAFVGDALSLCQVKGILSVLGKMDKGISAMCSNRSR